MTQNEMVLAAVSRCAKKYLSAADIAFYAWQAYPQEFSLEGYNHPDSHKVFCTLSGRRGLIQQGYLKRENSRYCLTPEGALKVEGKVEGKAEGKAEKKALKTTPGGTNHLTLNSQDEALLAMLFDTQALHRWEMSEEEEIRLGQAVDYLGPEPHRLGLSLNRLITKLESKHAVLTSGRVVYAQDVRVLDELRHYLVDRFGSQLERRKIDGRSPEVARRQELPGEEDRGADAATVQEPEQA